jgi:hypothetical protein
MTSKVELIFCNMTLNFVMLYGFGIDYFCYADVIPTCGSFNCLLGNQLCINTFIHTSAKLHIFI